jgi:hypothetical protein
MALLGCCAGAERRKQRKKRGRGGRMGRVSIREI